MQSHRKKMLLGFISFVLIMACVPSVATPVAPLDANAISTIIMQTADAAAAQTMMAIPKSTTTATITATLPNTSTPESTFTPVGTIIFPTSTPISQVQYFRVKHDIQLSEFNYKSRTAASDWPEIWGRQTTEVFPMFVAPKPASGTHRTTMTGAWEILINRLNDNSKRKLNYVKADNTALFNGAGFPQMESLTMGGNIIVIDEIQDGWGRVRTIDYNNPGNLNELNYLTRPDLIHKFVVVGWRRSTKTTYYVNPPVGELYWPLVSSRAVWMSLENLEPFPKLPITVTANTMQEVRTQPDKASSLSDSVLVKGESARVIEYYLSASDVWGRISSGGWITLLIHEKGILKYKTSWTMETSPPVPPSQ